MVTASFQEENGALEMRVQGHASFAKAGMDPVCAGASVLALTVAQCVDSIAEHGGTKEKPTIRVSGGNVRVRCEPTEECMGQLLIVYQTAQVGMLLLAGAYPRHASVKTFAAAQAEAIEDSSTSRTD